MKRELKPCPCGKTPTKLHIHGGDSKYMYVYGDCCNMWDVEFRTQYFTADTKECMDLGIEAWNAAPRKCVDQGREMNGLF